MNEGDRKTLIPIPFLNPDPVARLVGCANEAPVVVDGREVTALVDLGAQVSTISARLCEELDLEIQPLGRLLELEGTGGAAIPYLGFVEVNLQIPGVRRYNEDVLLSGHPHHDLLRKSSSRGGFQNNRQNSELYDCGRVSRSNCNLVTGSFWSSYVRLIAAVPQQLRETDKTQLIWGK